MLKRLHKCIISDSNRTNILSPFLLISWCIGMHSILYDIICIIHLLGPSNFVNKYSKHDWCCTQINIVDRMINSMLYRWTVFYYPKAFDIENGARQRNWSRDIDCVHCGGRRIVKWDMTISIWAADLWPFSTIYDIWWQSVTFLMKDRSEGTLSLCWSSFLPIVMSNEHHPNAWNSFVLCGNTSNTSDKEWLL